MGEPECGEPGATAACADKIQRWGGPLVTATTGNHRQEIRISTANLQLRAINNGRIHRPQPFSDFNKVVQWVQALPLSSSSCGQLDNSAVSLPTKKVSGCLRSREHGLPCDLNSENYHASETVCNKRRADIFRSPTRNYIHMAGVAEKCCVTCPQCRFPRLFLDHHGNGTLR